MRDLDVSKMLRRFQVEKHMELTEMGECKKKNRFEEWKENVVINSVWDTLNLYLCFI